MLDRKRQLSYPSYPKTTTNTATYPPAPSFPQHAFNNQAINTSDLPQYYVEPLTSWNRHEPKAPKKIISRSSYNPFSSVNRLEPETNTWANLEGHNRQNPKIVTETAS